MKEEKQGIEAEEWFKELSEEEKSYCLRVQACEQIIQDMEQVKTQVKYPDDQQT